MLTRERRLPQNPFFAAWNPVADLISWAGGGSLLPARQAPFWVPSKADEVPSAFPLSPQGDTKNKINR